MSIDRYISGIELAPHKAEPSPFRDLEAVFGRSVPRPVGVGTPNMELPDDLTAAVDVGSLLSFVSGVGQQDRDDVLYSVQLAQRGASGTYDRFTQTRSWYQQYIEILENLGWIGEQFAFAHYDQSEGELRMDQAALSALTALATQNQLAVLTEAVNALKALAEDDGTIRLFDFHTSASASGNFQIGAVQLSDNDALSLAVGAFYFRSTDTRRRFLFFKWGAEQVNFWSAAQKMTFNRHFYAQHREAVLRKLGASAATFISELKLG